MFLVQIIGYLSAFWGVLSQNFKSFESMFFKNRFAPKPKIDNILVTTHAHIFVKKYRTHLTQLKKIFYRGHIKY